MTADATERVDHIQHTVTMAGAQINGQQAGPVSQYAQGGDMAQRQIHHVNIVTDTGAIGRRVIIAEDGHAVALAQRHAEHQRNEMHLGRMVFAALGRAAGCVEISQGGIAEANRAVEPG